MQLDVGTWPNEILEAYGTKLWGQAPWMTLAALAAVLGVAGWRVMAGKLERRTLARLETGVVIALVALGGLLAWQEASLFDDAYISFRYVQNFTEGNGLVFNPGERVEGYTNFLWTLAIALIVIATPFEAPEVALHLALACFLANLVVIHLLAKELQGEAWKDRSAPLALCLVLGQYAFTSYGTTGLETGCASLLVDLGALFLVRSRGAKQAALSGGFLILATLTRPDHAIFYAAGSCALVVVHGRAVLGSVLRRAGLADVMDSGLRVWLSYAAPFLLYVVYLVWKIAYYGDVVPNTYWAKSADQTYWSAGFICALTFYASSHLWVLLLMALAWSVVPIPNGAHVGFRVFLVAGVVTYNVYVMKVGGDFMFGRFYVTTIPLVALGASSLILGRVASPEHPRRRVGWICCALAGATVFNLRLVEKTNQWYQTDETKLFALSSVYPPVVDHHSWRTGQEFRRLSEAGVRPTLATSGPGMIGYLSKLTIVDTLGLTDAYVAHLPLEKRGRPGHEKRAPTSYLRERGVHLSRYQWDKRHASLTRIRLGESGRPWHILRYDREMMAAIKDAAPEWRFRDIEAHLDRYISQLEKREPKEVRRDYRFFRLYYFDHNDDPERQEAFEVWLRNHRK